MCTATWLMDAEGYELFFNRDERRTRKPALPPAVQERNGVKFIAPKDGDFGGSWIGVNEYGVTLGLLNWYEANVAALLRSAPPITNETHSRFAEARLHPSRGLLLISLMDGESPEEIARLLRHKNLADYPPFLLLILAPKITPMLLKWDGKRISSNTDPSPPITTSSFDTANVIRARQEQFQALRHLDTQALTSYHHSHHPKGDAYCGIL